MRNQTCIEAEHSAPLMVMPGNAETRRFPEHIRLLLRITCKYALVARGGHERLDGAPGERNSIADRLRDDREAEPHWHKPDEGPERHLPLGGA